MTTLLRRLTCKRVQFFSRQSATTDASGTWHTVTGWRPPPNRSDFTAALAKVFAPSRDEEGAGGVPPWLAVRTSRLPEADGPTTIEQEHDAEETASRTNRGEAPAFDVPLARPVDRAPGASDSEPAAAFGTRHYPIAPASLCLTEPSNTPSLPVSGQVGRFQVRGG